MTTLSKYSKAKFYQGIELWRVDKEFAEPMFNYLVYGYSPGSFFTAVLANDFISAVARSHSGNTMTALKALTGWITDCMPRSAWGSYDNVKAWMARDEEDRRQVLIMHNLILAPRDETWRALNEESV